MRSSRGPRSWAGAVFLLALAAALAGRAAASDVLSLGPVWSLPLSSALVAPPSADARAVYLPLRSGKISSLALADGRPLWEAELDTAYALALGGDLIFAATPQEVVAIETSSGRTAWRLHAPGAVAAPSFRGGWVLVGLKDGTLLAIKADDGALVWRAGLGSPLSKPVTIDGERVYAPLADGGVAALEITSGRTLWRSRLPAAAGPIAAAGDRLYVGSTDNFFYSLDATDGRRRWRWRTGADVIGLAAVDAWRVYFVSLDNVLRALDADSGVLRWAYPLDSRPLAGPVLDQDVLVLSVIGTALPVVRAADGKLAGTLPAPRELAQPPVVLPEAPAHPEPPSSASDSVSGLPAPAIRAVIVTGSDVGEWRVYGLGRSLEPAPRRLTELPGRPLPPSGPPAPPAPPRPGDGRLP